MGEGGGGGEDGGEVWGEGAGEGGWGRGAESEGAEGGQTPAGTIGECGQAPISTQSPDLASTSGRRLTLWCLLRSLTHSATEWRIHMHTYGMLACTHVCM